MLEFDFETYNNKYISIDEKASYKDKIDVLKEKFNNEELGHWLNLNTYVQKDEFSKIKRVSEDIRNLCDVFVVIGIGGSYMGSKAVIEALSPMYNRTKPEIIFLGKNINPNEYIEVLDYIKGKEIAVNVISKSGTTLEPSIAFDLILDLMKEKYTEEELK